MISTTQIEMKNDFKDLKTDLTEKINEIEEDLTNIKDKHLQHINDKMNKIELNQTEKFSKIERDNKWIQILLIALIGYY